MAIHKREIKLNFDPIISANSTSSEINYLNDQSWKISLDSKSPSGLVIETTYGLQAKIAQLFPVFLDANNLPIQDPKPKYILRNLYPEQAQYQVDLFPDMDVTLTLQVPNSHTILGEIEFQCKNNMDKKIQVGVLMRLNPGESGQAMSAQQFRGQTILAGETGSIFPVLMSIGLPKLIHRPHPGLCMQLLITGQHPASFRWAVSSSSSLSVSRENCASVLKKTWAISFGRAETQNNQRLITFQTGNELLDDALYISQVQAQRLILSKTDKLPFATLVTTRQPDQGYSSRKDSQDYDAGWSGPSAWDLYHAIRNLYLPAIPEVCEGMFHNFIQLQQGYGEIDLRPGLGGQKTRLLASPIMAVCCQEIYDFTGNKKRLAEAYPILNYFHSKWLDQEHDLDQDGIPEWKHPAQSGWESNPLIDSWQDTSRGYASDAIESPAMAAFMYKESQAMMNIAHELGNIEDEHRYKQNSERIQSELDSFWDNRRKVFRYRDRDTHLTPSGSILSRGTGSGTFSIERTFDHLTRMCLTIRSTHEGTRPLSAQLVGIDANGEPSVEQIPRDRFIWREGRTNITSRQVFAKIDSISLNGFTPKDNWTIAELDLSQSDLTLFLPLWAKMVTQDTATRLVEQNLVPNWIEPYPSGIPMILTQGAKTKASSDFQRVDVFFLSMIIDGLLQYGFLREANKLVNSMMEAIINISSKNGYFSESFQAASGNPIGRINHLHGYPPVGLYMRNLGVGFKSADTVIIWGKSPYQNEIVVKYRGTRVIRSETGTDIQFQDGQRIHLDGEEKKTIQWKTTGGGK